MKVAVIGNGNVGKAVFRELQVLREINELVLVGRNVAACESEVLDYLDAIPLRIDTPGHMYGGGYELAAGADILIYCTGPSIKQAGSDRNSLLDANIEVIKTVFPEIDKYAPPMRRSSPSQIRLTLSQQPYRSLPAGRVKR